MPTENISVCSSSTFSAKASATAPPKGRGAIGAKALIAPRPLQRAHPCSGTDDGYKISRLHLLIDEFLKRLANRNGALEGEPEIVDYQRYGSSHLIEAQACGRNDRQRHF